MSNCEWVDRYEFLWSVGIKGLYIKAFCGIMGFINNNFIEGLNMNYRYILVLSFCLMGTAYGMRSLTVEGRLTLAILKQNLEEIGNTINSQPIVKQVALLNKGMLNCDQLAQLTPLMFAVYIKNYPLIELLLKLGASPVGKGDGNESLKSPLQQAIMAQDQTIISLFKDAYF